MLKQRLRVCTKNLWKAEKCLSKWTKLNRTDSSSQITKLTEHLSLIIQVTKGVTKIQDHLVRITLSIINNATMATELSPDSTAGLDRETINKKEKTSLDLILVNQTAIYKFKDVKTTDITQSSGKEDKFLWAICHLVSLKISFEKHLRNSERYLSLN